MSDPLELSVEKLAVALLNQSSDVLAIIPTGRIFVQADDSPADPANANRIVCSATPREVERRGYRYDVVNVWRVPCVVTLYTAPGFPAESMQTALAAITAALNVQPDTAAAAIADAASICAWDDTDEGDFDTQDEGRKRAKTWNFLADA